MENEFTNEKHNNDGIIIDNDNFNEKIEIVNETSANRVNVSKQIKLNDFPTLTLFELMDEPSFTKIFIDFPEIKEIKFSRKDFYGEKYKGVKKLIREGIPTNFLFKRIRYETSPKKVSVYSPKTIKKGKSFFIAKKKNNINKNLNNNFNNTEQKNNINLEKFKLKNINIYELV